MKPGLIVAIDGPAGSGKSTVARAIAQALGLPHLDTGAMYRALAFKTLPLGMPAPADVAQLLADTSIEISDTKVMLDGTDVSGHIRDQGVSERASLVAAQPAVRDWMVQRQRSWIGDGGGVIEGRDIGTVVFPDAPLKIFLTASPEVRARRRGAEIDSGDAATTLQHLEKRDRDDSERAVSPLLAADDAVTIDTSEMTVDEIVDKVLGLVRERGFR